MFASDTAPEGVGEIGDVDDGHLVAAGARCPFVKSSVASMRAATRRLTTLIPLLAAVVIAWPASALADGPTAPGIEGESPGASLPAAAAAWPSTAYEIDEDAARERYEAMTMRKSPGLLVAGILLTTAGGTTAAAGLILNLGGCSDSMPPQCGTFAPRIVGIPMVIHGLGRSPSACR